MPSLRARTADTVNSQKQQILFKYTSLFLRHSVRLGQTGVSVKNERKYVRKPSDITRADLSHALTLNLPAYIKHITSTASTLLAVVQSYSRPSTLA